MIQRSLTSVRGNVDGAVDRIIKAFMPRSNSKADFMCQVIKISYQATLQTLSAFGGQAIGELPNKMEALTKEHINAIRFVTEGMILSNRETAMQLAQSSPWNTPAVARVPGADGTRLDPRLEVEINPHHANGLVANSEGGGRTRTST